MSFGFGVGDFLTVIELANKVRRDFVDAPDQFRLLTDEVRSLTTVLNDILVLLDEHDLSEKQTTSLHEINNSCQHVLDDIERVADKYSTLAPQDTSVKRRAKRVWKRFKWDPNEARDLRSRITSNITVLQSFMAARTDNTILRLEQRQGRQENRQELQDILDWLTPIDTAPQQADFIRRRQPGTGQWLLESPEYNKWKAAKGGILFCHGIPGAGKTILSSIVVDDLQKCHTSEDVAVCYFYCNFQRQEEQRIENIVLSFVKQLAQVSTTIPECLKALFDEHKARKSRPSLEEATETLYSMSKTFSKVFCVVDALDECQTVDGCQRQLIEYLIDFCTLVDADLIATSRPIPHIEEKFRRFVSLEVLASSADIQKYIEGSIQNLPGFVSRNSTLVDEITSAIAESTRGMFLLAKLHLDSLKGKRSPRELRKTLRTLARGNDAYTEAYRTTMSRIHGQLVDQKELAIQALKWIVYAERELSTSELQHALGVEIGEFEFFDDNIPDLQDTIAACCGLVTVDETSGVVRLVHYTTQEFFEDQGRSYLPDAHAEIASTCATYLSFDTFKHGPCTTTREFKARLTQFPLYDYSGRFWGFHAQHSQDLKAVHHFLSLPAQVEGSSQALLVDRRFADCFDAVPSQMTALHLAAYFGLAEYLATMHQSAMSIDSQDSHCRTPLSWAAANGHEKIARLFLEKNAQIDIADEYGRTPLSYAALNGYENILRLLLEKNAQFNTIGQDGRTPLSWAAVDGHEKIARLFPKKNTQIDIADKYGRTPLLYTALSGREDIMRLLLEKNAQVDIADENGRTPLSWAAIKSYEYIVRLLLEKDAQIDIADKGGQTPLSHAVSNGHKEIVRLLLEKNSQIDIADKGGQTPLSHAVSNGHKEIVRLLLEKNSQIDIADKGGQTPLSHAVSNGHKEIVRLLLEKNSQVDIADEYGRTPLSYAAVNGYEYIVHLLLEQNAQVDTLDTAYGRTPLSYAASNGHKEILRLLLEKNAQVDIANSENQTPLWWAARYGHKAAMRLLLDHGASIVETKAGSSPTFFAVEHGHKDILEVIIKNGASIEMTGRRGCTMLTVAAECGHRDIVELLLNHGANIHKATNSGETALLLASKHGCDGVVEILLKHGAMVNAKDTYGRTPLIWAVHECKWEAMKLLLTAGASCQIMDNYIRSAFTYAAIRGNLEALGSLLAASHLQLNERDFWGSTAVSFTARFGYISPFMKIADLPSVDLLLDDSFGRTPLWWAQKQNHGSIAEHIVKCTQFSYTHGSSSNPVIGQSKNFNVDDYSHNDLFDGRMECVVCLCNLQGSYYWCDDCAEILLRICGECYDLGARCLSKSHFLKIEYRMQPSNYPM